MNVNYNFLQVFEERKEITITLGYKFVNAVNNFSFFKLQFKNNNLDK